MSNIILLPIYYKSARLPSIGKAIVDEAFGEFLSEFNWFLSDQRTCRPPRTRVQRKFILLSRLVILIGTKGLESVEKMSKDQLVEQTENIPRLQMIGESPWDCRLESIKVVGRLGERNIAYSLPAKSAFPQAVEQIKPPGLERIEIYESSSILSQPVRVERSGEKSVKELLGE